MSSEADPFLLQKIEFLELELQESKEREEKLKKSYDSLLALMNATAPTFRSDTEEELEKLKLAHALEVKDLEHRFKLQHEAQESELRFLRAHVKELELALSGREKSLLQKPQEHMDLEKRLQGLIAQFEHHKETAASDKERLVKELRQVAKEKEELLTIITHAEAKTAEQRDKLASLKAECETMRNDLRNTRQENEALKANRPTKRYKDAVEEEKQRLLSQVQSLQGKIQSYSSKTVTKSEVRKSTVRDAISDRSELSTLKAQIVKAEKTIEVLRSELNEERRKMQTLQLSSPQSQRSDDTRQVCTSLSTVRQSRADESLVIDKLKGQVVENSQALAQTKDQLRDSKVETAQLQLQKERLQIDLERMNIESKQMKLDWSVERERLLEEIRKLKSEVKFLIGKLVKAKGKLAVEGELTETLKKDEPTRSKSVNKTRLSARQASPQRHCVSPLNLSAITRAESPCWNQSMEAL